LSSQSDRTEEDDSDGGGDDIDIEDEE